MIKPARLKKNDTIALVSLSSNNIADPEYSFRFDLIEKRLKKLGLNYVFSKNALLPRAELNAHPELIAEDMVACLKDKSIKAIIAINGGRNAIDVIPHLMKIDGIDNIVRDNPKILLGFSDTTIQHFFFYNRGVQTYYGQNIVCDICEQEPNMFPYSLKYFKSFFKAKAIKIKPSKFWYHERPAYDKSQLNVRRQKSKNTTYEVFNLAGGVVGEVLGGCIERINSMLSEENYIKNNLLPDISIWQDKIVFLESCDFSLDFTKFQLYLLNLDNYGVFKVAKAIVYGRNPNEQYAIECKEELLKYANKYNIPLIYNANIGHSSPRAIIPYGARVCIDRKGMISLLEPFVK
jgi:muramoyltetrapeptide carboxypeptidase LdcA involved in peptidoglycan recycling